MRRWAAMLRAVPLRFSSARDRSPATVSPLTAIDAANLKAGDGLVAAFDARGVPGIAVLGGEDNGLTAAAVTFAGHLPFVGDQKGPTTDRIANDVQLFLAAKDIPVTSAVMPAVFVKWGGEGIERAVVDLQLAGGDFVRAQVALNQFRATATRDAKRPLVIR